MTESQDIIRPHINHMKREMIKEMIHFKQMNRAERQILELTPNATINGIVIKAGGKGE